MIFFDGARILITQFKKLKNKYSSVSCSEHRAIPAKSLIGKWMDLQNSIHWSY
jgi:hypothetical protein